MVALAKIVRTMGATLNSSVDPCESKTLVISDSKPGLDQNKVLCNCHPNSSTCHITILYSFLLSLFAFSFAFGYPENVREIFKFVDFFFFGSFLIFFNFWFNLLHYRVLRMYSLPGTLPPQLVDLPYLEEL